MFHSFHQPDAPAPGWTGVRIRGLADAGRVLTAAGRAGVAVTLVGIPSAAGSMGSLWWVRLVERLRAEFPDQPFAAILDCADAPGHCLGALRSGVTDVALAAPPDVLDRVHAIANASGARLHPPPTGVVDPATLPGRPEAALARLLDRGRKG